MDMGQVSALKLYQSMGGKLSEHTLKVMKNAEAGNLSPTPATRLESAGTIELTGIYADPAIQGSAHRFGGSAAQGAVNALKSIRDNELVNINSSIRSSIEEQLGRPLSDEESFIALSSEERMKLSPEVRKNAMQAILLEIQIAQGIGEMDLLGAGFFGDDAPEKIREFFVASSTEEAAFESIGRRVEQQAALLSAANDLILSNPLMELAFENSEKEGFSDEVRDALTFRGDSSLAELRLQLFSHQWGRFSRGEARLFWGEQRIEYAQTMYNAFVPSGELSEVDGLT